MSLPEGYRHAHRRLALLVSILGVAAGPSACTRAFDTIPASAAAAQQLTGRQASPAWQRPTDGREVDVLRLTPGNRVLVQTWNTDDMLFGLNRDHTPQSLMLLDATTGNVAWSFDLVALGIARQNILAVDPVVLLQAETGEGRKLMALALETGAAVWEADLAESDWATAVPSLGLLAVGRAEGDGASLRALEIATGTERWSRTISPGASGGVQLEAFGSTLVVAGREVMGLDARSGAAVWQVPSVGRPKLLVLGEDLVVAAEQSTSLVGSDGQTRWTAPGTGPALQVAGAPSLVLVLAATAGGGSVLVALDRATGATKWTHQPQTTVSSMLLGTADAVYYTALDALVALGSADGATRWVAGLPDSLRGAGLLPDLLEVVGGRVIVGRELGVAAFDPASGAGAFAAAVPETFGYTYAYLYEKAASIVRVLGLEPKAVISSAPPSDPQQLLGFANDCQRWIDQTAGAEVADGGGYFLLAGVQNIQVSNGMVPMGSTLGYNAPLSGVDAAVVGGFVAVGSAMMGLASTGVGMRTRYQLEESLLQLGRAAETHARSMIGRWYIRPFLGQSTGFVVVDLETGMRSDVVLSPPNRALRTSDYSNVTAFVLDPSTQRFVSKGLGLDPAKWEAYAIYDFPEVSQNNNAWQLPRVSIIAFELPGLAFRPIEPGDAVTPARPMPTDVERSFLAAAVAGDEDRVESLAEAGCSVNARDEFGRTALMLAALYQQEDMVELLGELGADPTVLDAEGLTAYEYCKLAPLGYEDVLSIVGTMEDVFEDYADR
jgi:outer membrane protein assembly factor BamB